MVQEKISRLQRLLPAINLDRRVVSFTGAILLALYFLLSIAQQLPAQQAVGVILLVGSASAAFGMRITEQPRGRQLLLLLIPLLLSALLPIAKIPGGPTVVLPIVLFVLFRSIALLLHARYEWIRDQYWWALPVFLIALSYFLPHSIVVQLIIAIALIAVYGEIDWLQKDTGLLKLFLSALAFSVSIPLLVYVFILPTLRQYQFLGIVIENTLRLLTIVSFLSAVLMMVRLATTPIIRSVRTKSPIRTKLILSFLFTTALPFGLLFIIVFTSSITLIGSYQSNVVRKLMLEASEELLTLANAVDIDQFGSGDSLTTLTLNTRSGKASVTPLSIEISNEVIGTSVRKKFTLRSKRNAPEILRTLSFRDSIPATLTTLISDGKQYFSLALSQRSDLVVAALRTFSNQELERCKSKTGADLTLYALTADNANPAEQNQNATAITIKTETNVSLAVSEKVLATVRDSSSTHWRDRLFTVGLSWIPTLRNDRGTTTNRGSMLIIQLSAAGLLRMFDDAGNPFNTALLYFLGVLTIVLLLVILVAVNVGFQISQLIASGADQLIEGTLALRRGELSHRIPVESRDELGEVAFSFNLMATEITRMMSDIRTKERLERDLQIARSIQINLLPKEPPVLPGWEIVARSDFAQDVGGDFYDYFRLSDNCFGMSLGDVSGKGIPAALLMSNVQASMRMLSSTEAAPEIVLARLNNMIFESTSAELFITMFYMRLDWKTGEIFYVNAGHDYPLLVSATGIEQLKTGGMVIGAFQNAEYTCGRAVLNPGESLVIYSDGIPEAMATDGTPFGEERLRETVLRYRTAHAEIGITAIEEAVNTFAGEEPPSDDRTMLWIRRTL
ncbi:MAG: SpoIIE family protein phosphatase [bacterium]|nr:SpoIIE family protein phosphatase [bacterium]